EQRRQPDQAGRDPLEHVRLVEREREHQHRHRREREHLVDDDTAAPLDPQVLCRHEPGDPPAVHAERSTIWPATTSTTRSASEPARSRSWLATITVARDATA